MLEKAINNLKKVIYGNTFIDIEYYELDEFRKNFEIVLKHLKQKDKQIKKLKK